MGIPTVEDVLRDRISELENEVKLYKEVCQRQAHISVYKDREITELVADRDYWKSEALKWAGQMGEDKLNKNICCQSSDS